jgi:SAM-dependent methyltransferase
MILWLISTIAVLVVIFGFVVFVGPPYLPTMRRQTDVALDLLDLKPGETLLELGSGDGRVILAAAKRGLKVVGIELNPLLALVSVIVTWRYRKQVRVIWGSYWGRPWPRADAIFTFMLTKYMPKLDARIEQWRPKPIPLASFAFRIPGKEPIREQAGVYLYEYK